MVENANYYFSHFSSSSGCFELLKKDQIFNFNIIWLEKLKTYFESVISPSFDELNCSPIVVMNRMETMFQDLPFCCTNKVLKDHNLLFHFRHMGGTTFLVLAQTLMYWSLFRSHHISHWSGTTLLVIGQESPYWSLVKSYLIANWSEVSLLVIGQKSLY